LRPHSNPNWTKRNTVAKDQMKDMMKKDNEEMTKRMDDHNHMTKHMMKKDDVKKMEKKKATKVPLLMGLGLPVLRKRFLNSFQDEWADYASWGIDKRSDDLLAAAAASDDEEYLDLELESAKENFQPSVKKKRRLGSEKKKRSWPLL